MPSVPWGCHRSPSPGQIYSQPYGGRTHPKSGCKWRDGSLLHPLTRCSAPALNAPGDFGVCPPLPRAPELGFSQGCVVVVIPQTQGGHAPPCPSPKPLPVPLLYFWSWDSRAAHLGPAGSGQGWPEHPPIQAPPPPQEHPRGGHPFGRGQRHHQGDLPAPPSRLRTLTTKTPPDSPAPTAAFAHAARAGCNPQTVGTPPRPDTLPHTLSLSPRGERGDRTEVVALWGVQGGDATPSRKRRRFVMQCNCSRRQRWGDASPACRALTPAADTPSPLQLPAPHARQNSWAERGPRTHRAKPEGAAPLTPRGPRKPFVSSQ